MLIYVLDFLDGGLKPPKLYGERRFDVAAVTLWNSLPASLRNEQSLEAFKKELKTHLFKIAFVKSRSIDLDL
jgi:hypothetical protein